MRLRESDFWLWLKNMERSYSDHPNVIALIDEIKDMDEIIVRLQNELRMKGQEPRVYQ